MDSRSLARLLSVALLGASLAAVAQSVPELRFKPVPPPVPAAPFVPESTGQPIRFVPAANLAPQDRLIVSSAESAIAEQAARGGIDFSGPGWSFQQVACPALPNHLFLQYRRAAGTGSESVFSASIPRNGQGRVRVVPVRRRGYSLFSPAPINALTLSAFNHIRAEEPDSVRAEGWVGNALCYAALAGAQPRLPDPDAEPTLDHPVTAVSAVLHVRTADGETIQFADEAAPRPTLWTMTFNQKGKLLKATHGSALLYSLKPVPATPPAAVRPVPVTPGAAFQPVAQDAARPWQPAPQDAPKSWQPVPAGK